MTSVDALLPKAAGTDELTEMLGGSSLYVLKWTSKASGSVPKLSNTLTISVGTQLPVEEGSTASGGIEATTKLAQWGEKVAVVAPPAATTIASSKVTG
jgi:hypothetical protein